VKQTYSFLPYRPFFLLLGLWEMAIGCGMVTRLGLRLALVLLWLRLAGTFGALYLAPQIVFPWRKSRPNADLHISSSRASNSSVLVIPGPPLDE